MAIPKVLIDRKGLDQVVFRYIIKVSEYEDQEETIQREEKTYLVNLIHALSPHEVIDIYGFEINQKLEDRDLGIVSTAWIKDKDKFEEELRREFRNTIKATDHELDNLLLDFYNITNFISNHISYQNRQV